MTRDSRRNKSPHRLPSHRSRFRRPATTGALPVLVLVLGGAAALLLLIVGVGRGVLSVANWRGRAVGRGGAETSSRATPFPAGWSATATSEPANESDFPAPAAPRR